MGSRFYENFFPFHRHGFRGRIPGLLPTAQHNEPRGLNFGKPEPDAQNEFHSHARAENRDF